MNLGLGVDTGGTYTDAVVWDFDSGNVLRKAKALTTPHKLNVGISNSIEDLGEFDAEKIRLVSVSTTLATNAAVEGRGGRVCLLAIGYKPKILEKFGLTRIPHIKSVHIIKGGHDIMGEELIPLDVVQAKKIIQETKDNVDAYAVSAYGGVRNPVHEIQLKELISSEIDYPVVCGHELTSQLDSIKRASTAALNARLMPLIRNLIESIKQVLADKCISAPLMIVKGDGHIMSTKFAMERPVETLLSGPAASIVGGNFLSGIDNGVIIDMGGTTTDIAVLKAGEPAITKDGASVGGWRTCVRAADIRTVGIGGDSHVTLDSDGLKISPRRVIPLSIAASFHRQIIDELKFLKDLKQESILVPPCDCFLMLREPDGIPLNAKEKDILKALSNGPKSLIKLAGEIQAVHPSLLGTSSLEEAGLIGRIGLTPTDILHAKGIYTQWDAEAAKIGVNIYAQQLGQATKDVMDNILNSVNKKLAIELLSKFVSDEISTPSILGCDVCQLLVNNALETDGTEKDISIGMKLNIPLIAIGAPVEAYFPRVASMLNTKLVIPEHAEVANAVGAITGTIVETVEITLTPVYTPFGVAHFTVHTPIDKRDFSKLKNALEYSKKVAEKIAVQRAKKAGANEIEIQLEVIDRKGEVAKDQGEEVFLGSSIRATAMGKSFIN